MSPFTYFSHPRPLLTATTRLFSACINSFRFVSESAYKWDHVAFVFFCLNSRSVMPSGSVHDRERRPPLLWLTSVLLCVCPVFFICSSLRGHLDCFRGLVVVNSAAVNMGCICLFKLVFSFSLDKYSEVELLNHMVVLFLIFCGTSILCSIVHQSAFPPTVYRGPFSPHPLHHLLFLVFLIIHI